VWLYVATEQAMALNTKDILDPLDSFKTYNEFFMRKLKPESRPIFASDNPHVATQPADARLTLYEDIETCTKVRAVHPQPRRFLAFHRLGLRGLVHRIGAMSCEGRIKVSWLAATYGSPFSMQAIRRRFRPAFLAFTRDYEMGGDNLCLKSNHAD
jgi:hypothetical protein